ncbi:MAG: YgjP-like metallopeptidase domain-containing protein, partial [Pseudomonadota bacterium]
MPSQTPSRTTRTVEAGSIDLNGRTLPVTVRVDRRAKRLIMRVEPSGRIRITCPHRRDIGAALAMAESRREWIGSRLEEMAAPLPFVPGSHIPVLGRDRLIIRDEKATIARLDNQYLRVGSPIGRDPTDSVIRLLRREVQA